MLHNSEKKLVKPLLDNKQVVIINITSEINLHGACRQSNVEITGSLLVCNAETSIKTSDTVLQYEMLSKLL